VGNSTEEYAEQTGKSCTHCHLDRSGGGELTQAGETFLENLLDGTEEANAKTVQQGKKGIAHYIRFIAGLIHFITAIFWFGTILYVHIILKPAYAAHGLPKEEVRLGLYSILIMGITGTILTLYRVPSVAFLVETRFGILLMMKVALYLVLVSTALFVVLVIGPKLKTASTSEQLQSKQQLPGRDTPHQEDAESKDAFFVYKGKRYDVSQSKFWKEGVHFARHRAGEDLTDALDHAPHGERKIFAMPMIGEVRLSSAKKPARQKRVFYLMAYLNLVIVILIITILALWKWW
jgi:predicted heme/steroid binding protein